ncbi:hypothetical protein [Pedobacter aquatilis]|uniref:hypothetical protein n=1 Tax=Pedobacter aquatilis TaxID=351343 RepID=UPI00292F96C7|nr:hypothetical protein [Pedobacter aquatilis]
MKKNLILTLAVGVTALSSILSCKKESVPQESTTTTFSGRANVSAVVGYYESLEKVELFEKPNEPGTWQSFATYDGQTFEFSRVHLQDGYAVGYLNFVRTGTQEFPTGEYPTVVAGQQSEWIPAKLFAYKRAVCTTSITKSTKSYSQTVFVGKGAEGNTFVVYRDSLQNHVYYSPLDYGELPIDFYDRVNTTDVRLTRITFGMNCLGPDRVVPIKLSASKDAQGKIHFWVGSVNLKEPKVYEITDVVD